MCQCKGSHGDSFDKEYDTMKTSIKHLRLIIQEELHRLNEAKWDVWKTKQMQRVGSPIRVDANTTDEAGKLAAQQFGGGVDPYTLEIDKVEDESSYGDVVKGFVVKRALEGVRSVMQGLASDLDLAVIAGGNAPGMGGFEVWTRLDSAANMLADLHGLAPESDALLVGVKVGLQAEILLRSLSRTVKASWPGANDFPPMNSYISIMDILNKRCDEISDVLVDIYNEEK